MATGNEQPVRSSFEAFSRGDWARLSEVMDADVRWLRYDPGDWDCHDRSKVPATLFERQHEEVVTALDAVIAVDERVFVQVTGPRLSQWGRPGGQASMVVTVREGRIVRMQDYSDRAMALAGAGLAPEAADEPEAEQPGQPLSLRADAPLTRKVTRVIRSGDAASPERLLREHPGLAAARLDDPETRSNLWPAAALGLTERVRGERPQARPEQEASTTLWGAAHGGQRENAQLLLDNGAAPNWVGHDRLTAAAGAERSGAHELAAWLRERSASEVPSS